MGQIAMGQIDRAKDGWQLISGTLHMLAQPMDD